MSVEGTNGIRVLMKEATEHSLAPSARWWWYSVAEPCPTLYDSTVCSAPGFSVLHYHLEFAQTHIH